LAAEKVDSAKQVPLYLPPTEEYGPKYFVVHSGVSPVIEEVDQLLELANKLPETFFSLCLYSPKGFGKSHLLRLLEKRALERGISQAKIALIDIELSEDSIGQYVACYNQLISSGGLLLASLDVPTIDSSLSPHLLSRLKRGRMLEVKLPEESELMPLLKSLLARRNLALSDRALQYVLRRTARDPLSFSEIFARISTFSLAEMKPAGLGIIRQLMNTEPSKKGLVGK